MNYRHIYHAGSFADIFKHCILIALLNALLEKPKALTYLETHAGIGLYNLNSEAAQKTKEYESGLNKLKNLKSPPKFIEEFLKLAEKIPGFYPGSPLIAAELLRVDDKMILCELHKDDCASLKLLFSDMKHPAAIHCLDGYQGLKAFTPPTPRRGLVLIDPPFEVESEIDDLITGLKTGMERWPNATYAIWYPIKNTDQHVLLIRALRKLNLQYLNPTLIVNSDKTSTKLIGTGMVIINPPFGCENKINEISKALAKILA